jgi:hypothetical protein
LVWRCTIPLWCQNLSFYDRRNKKMCLDRIILCGSMAVSLTLLTWKYSILMLFKRLHSIIRLIGFCKATLPFSRHWSMDLRGRGTNIEQKKTSMRWKRLYGLIGWEAESKLYPLCTLSTKIFLELLFKTSIWAQSKVFLFSCSKDTLI